MKKTLTLFAAAISCGIASAQVESAFVKESDFESASTAVTAGTVLCKSENVSMKAAFDETYKPLGLIAEEDAYNAFTIGGESFYLSKGIQGAANAKEANYKELPKSGSVFQFDIAESGVLYAFAKLNSQKQYYVMNVKGGGEFAVVGYSISAFSADGATNYAFTMPDAEDPGFTNYTSGKKFNSLASCYQEATGNPVFSGEVKGVIAFPVSAGTYYVFAGSSKIVSDGFVFVKGATAVATVTTATVAEPDPEPETPATAVKNVTISSLDSNAPIYNLLGQRVQNGYKGICIQKGKKFMVK